MSLSLRLAGGMALPSLPQMLRGLLPRISIGVAAAPEEDPRLEELREQLQNQKEPPFMFDNGAILQAAPKKKMSYRRHRVKLYAPGNKQIQPLNNIVRCPACGHVKRSHFMCMHCFAEIKQFLKGKKKEDGVLAVKENPQTDLDPLDDRIVYPGKYLREDQRRLQERDWVPKREEPLLFDKQQVKHRK
ncbi:large ribosomal subunit protein bL32m [Diutina catenulata]